MAHNALLAVTLLLFLILALTQLAPEELLKPSRHTQWMAGLIGGVVSIVMQTVLDMDALQGGLVAYPTATAFIALYFGPLSAMITALLAFTVTVWTAAAAWSAAAAVLIAAGITATLWRYGTSRSWGALLGLAVSLPVTINLGLIAMGATVFPSSIGNWIHQLPWLYGAGLLMLGLGRLLVVGKAQSVLALQAANSTLRQREQQLRLALGSLGGGRWELDIGNQNFRCHGSFYEPFGIPSGISIDYWAQWYARRHPVDAARNAARIQRVMNGQEEVYDGEFRVRDNQGRWRWLISRGLVSERDASGQPMTLIGMHIDITAHREVQDALRTSQAKSDTIYQTLPNPAGVARVSDGRYMDVNPAFCDLLGLARDQVIGHTAMELSIWISERERRRLSVELLRQGKVDRLSIEIQKHGVRIPGLVSARSIIVDDENCFVFVFHDMTDAHRTADELRAVNSQLQQAGRLARLGAWEYIRGKGLVYWSEMCFHIHGLVPGAPLPRNYIDAFVAPPYRQALRDKLRASTAPCAEWSIEMEVLHADGRMVWVRARGEPVTEDGRMVRVRGVIQDIDEAKRADQRLRQSEERFSGIFQLMPYPMGLARRSDGHYVDINPAWVEMMGIAREDAIGHTAVELGVFSSQTRHKLIAEAEKAGQLSSYEMTLMPDSDSPRTVLQSMRAIEFDGEPCWLFSVHDITDRKRNEEQIREREELLSLTISAASLGLWDWNLQTGTVTGDIRWHTMRGADSEELAFESVQWKTVVEPEDVDRIIAEVARHAAHPQTPFDVTWRALAPAQEGARWVRNLGKIVSFGENGWPQRMLGVAIDVTPQREQEVLLQKLAHFDTLTGLPNRVLLARKLQECMALARANGTQLGVAYLDLDGFKPVNDRLGHGMGDRLLVVVADRLTRALRQLDCVARLGGDEFVILMPELVSATECERMLDRVMDSISAPYTLDAERVVVTASIGYTVFPSDEADADALLRHADQAMYIAKQSGRNRFHQFDAEQERAMQLQREQNRRLRDALAKAQFTLFLQPKVDMRSGMVVGAEALARWQHPKRGLLAPKEFLSLLHGTELEIGFGEWVVHAALAQLEVLLSHGIHLPVSINISAQHLQHAGFASWMAHCLALHPKVPTHLVEIEITESAALYELSAVASALTHLRTMGIAVSLDDFGTGYSSLTYLRRLPMDTLKIDQSFVHGMMGDPGDLAIVQGVIGLARSFGYHVIAEGVETIEQGQMLLELGCTQAQGYCIAGPLPLEDFVEWTKSWVPPIQWQQHVAA